MKLLIMGDSWAADWSSKYTDYAGWPELIAEQLTVTNIAQAGVSQYSIYRQFEQLDHYEYDKIIISITSPYRLYTPQHPYHTTGLHQNADLIYADCEYHASQHPDNESLVTAANYFKHHFDTEYAELLHHVWVDKCLDQCDPDKTIVTSNIQHNSEYVAVHQYVDGYPVWQSYPGKINHLNAEGNQVFAQNLLQLLT